MQSVGPQESSIRSIFASEQKIETGLCLEAKGESDLPMSSSSGSDNPQAWLVLSLGTAASIIDFSPITTQARLQYDSPGYHLEMSAKGVARHLMHEVLSFQVPLMGFSEPGSSRVDSNEQQC